jgi:hypothetical protein
MGVSHSLCLLLHKQNLLNGLEKLKDLQTNYSKCDPEMYIIHTPVSGIADRLGEIIGARDVEYQENLEHEFVVKSSFSQAGDDITITFNPWLQKMWDINSESNHLGIIINFCDTNNLVTLPLDHPSVPLLQYACSLLKPVFGWYDSEYTSVSDYAGYNYSKYQQPLWSSKNSRYISTMIIGKPLSNIIKKTFDLDNPDSGLHYAKNLGDDLYWLAWPTTIKSLENSKTRGVALLTNPQVGRHTKALHNIQAILDTISISTISS